MKRTHNDELGEIEKDGASELKLLRTAIQLKDAISSVTANFDPIGEVVNAVHPWRLEHDEDDYGGDESSESSESGERDEKEDKKSKPKKERTFDEWMYDMRDMHDKRMRTCHSGGIGIKQNKIFETRLIINVGDFKYDGRFCDLSVNDETNLKELIKSANVASFGDQKNLQTIIDENVRKGHDINDASFQVSEEIVKFVEDTWGKNFYPIDVKAVPYKINLYQKGDKFEGHKDTPDKNLVGTFLLGMSHLRSDSLQIYIHPNAKKETGKYCVWNDCRTGTWIGFHPDIAHKVIHDKDCIRATMSFKIYAKDVVPSISELTKQYVNNYMIENPMPANSHKQIGIILSHDYSLNTEALNGIDNLWYHVATKIAKNNVVTMIPVVLNTSMCYYHHESDSLSVVMKVYPLTVEHLQYLCGENGSKPNDKWKDVKFYKLSHSGHEWSCEHESYVEYTGNESRPESEDSLYMHRAMILDLI